MKGLLLKDWYVMKKHYKSFPILVVCLIVAGLFFDDTIPSMFFPYFLCLICGTIPADLLGHDERSRWLQYSATLPYTKAQIVSSKYLIGLCSQVTVLLLIGIAQSIKMTIAGNFVLGELVVYMLLTLIMMTLISSSYLPPVFKLGVEKGRIVSIVTLVILCVFIGLFAGFYNWYLTAEVPNAFLPTIAVICVGMYIFFWYLSVVFFEQRELQ